MDNKDKHIVWYADLDKLDKKDPFVKKWWLEQVLSRGTMKDIGKLDFKNIHDLLPSLNLPKNVKSLWEDYFSKKK
ncbi:hypothetical protein COT42_06515 [Candidatus Saganbacteria bacterium CG08_land_8_20_14_0_20_45_16]|uniref:Uncharacterized protein n=1 Tax=Candidatus Saganbacteria bacterium CG08_land_8_20_14_0_20_45_16 TaxID=2014293 RepID=A0A2H0XVL5_UNCSA|nr:MAG: hypothetical protein COT42_06515 [Candidatus Saganbacteria bacterium CG08_land_8_20_14_0_20_45_16]